MAMSDAQMELEQQQLMINQLKALIRERDEILESKDKELQVHIVLFHLPMLLLKSDLFIM